MVIAIAMFKEKNLSGMDLRIDFILQLREERY